MCYKIIVGLPPLKAEKWMLNLPQPARALSGSYDDLAQQMNNYTPFVVVQGVCSCRLFSRSSYEAVVKKYRRKGWTQSRIERAILDNEDGIQFGLSLPLRNWLADAVTDMGDAYMFIYWDSNRSGTELNYGRRLSLSAEEIGDYKVSIEAEQLIYIQSASPH